MSIENQKNRDLFLKVWIMFFLNHVLRALGIDEEIENVLPTEAIGFEKEGTFKIFDNLMDFKV
jgi:hypothetical protein